VSFFAENRLRYILQVCAKMNGSDEELSSTGDAMLEKVVPRLLGDDRLKGVRPVLLHGDLWAGNMGGARMVGKEGVEAVVFDPACFYGHCEFEMGIVKMYPGVGSEFYDEYFKLVPKAEPSEEWEDRVDLYELWHQLNHFVIYGPSGIGYRRAAISNMRKLIAKYAPTGG